ncbi:MAG TPA: hypothetical protein VK935_12035 [Actinomycetospora sp.]|nr:hypothetical protein [Actinomycetospora sp.]
MQRYLEVIDVEVATRAGDESLIRTHILPLPGLTLSIAKGSRTRVAWLRLAPAPPTLAG